jgi:light-independent protochlorophyllide reductase subunit B
VISAPVHVQDFPARYSPQMGWEGANVIFDTWIHPLVMGLEEHLLAMFREDFEFHDAAGPIHHGGHAPKPLGADAETAVPAAEVAPEERISGKMKEPDAAWLGRRAPTSWCGSRMPSGS